jgi:Flp pilus assembly protein TadB
MVADWNDRQRRALVIAALLVLATVFFVWGALSESSGHHETVHAGEATSEAASGEAGEGHAHGDEHSSELATDDEEFQPLGLDIESTPLVLAAAAVSLAIAGMVAWRPTRGWMIAVVVLGLVFAVVEVVEVIHQADEDNTGLLLLALAACITHLLAAILAGNEARTSEGARPALAT